jgi:hypothetical protein
VNLLEAHEAVAEAAAEICEHIGIQERTFSNSYLYDLRDVLNDAVNNLAKLKGEA